MPLTPSFGDHRIGPIQRLYRQVERRILTAFARTVLPGLGHGVAWVYLALSKLVRFRMNVTRIMDDADTEVVPAVKAALRDAWRDGQQAARDDDIPDGSDDTYALDGIIDTTVSAIRRAHDHVPRAVENAYREVVNAAIRDDESGDTLSGNAVRRALEAFARRGITGYVDPRNRRYDLPTYVELTVRAAITRAEVDAYCARVTAAGHDLVIVSDVPGACPRCTPFEGQVLSVSGRTVGTVTRHASTGQIVRVTVMCSIAEARARGLWHPNCRHTIRIWTPDRPTPPPAARVPDEVRARRRRQQAIARRRRQQERADLVNL